MPYKAWTRPGMNEETLARFRKLPKWKRDIVRALEKEVRTCAKALEKARADLATVAVDPKIHDPVRLSEYVNECCRIEGAYRAARSLWEVTAVRALNRDDADGPDLYRRALLAVYTTELRLDDGVSGRNNDARRSIFDGWLRFIRDARFLDGVPSTYSEEVRKSV